MDRPLLGKGSKEKGIMILYDIYKEMARSDLERSASGWFIFANQTY